MAGQHSTAEFTIDDSEFRRGLATAVNNLNLSTVTELLALGIAIQNGARDYCPVRTGRLRSSIMAVPGEDAQGAYVDIGTNVEYARAVEYGYRNRAPEPYLRPSVLEQTSGWDAKGIHP